jgi:hypothetical protein
MPNYELIHLAYCGMPTPYGTGERADMRDLAARKLRLRRRQGFPVTTLEIGERWEIMEPEDCMMVPDQCGVMVLRVDPKSARECFECGCTVDKDDPCCSAEPEEEDDET